MPTIPFANNISSIKAYGSDVTRVMAYGEKVYTKQSAIPDYLCFTALESGTFTLTVPAVVTTTYLSYMEYSLDGKTWTKTDNSSSDVTITTPSIPIGGKVYWRGSGSAMGTNSSEANRSKFSSSGRFDVSGHIMSLLVGDDFANYESLTNYNTNGIRNATFSRLFNGCTGLVNAKDLVVPSFSDYYQYIFTGLFRSCSSLVTAPALPSTTLALSCYNAAFYECTSLLASATLPATTLAQDCYRYMYYGCSNLETVNPILATTASGTNCMNQMFRSCSKITRVELNLTGALTESCCYQMFQLCSNLSYVKCLATDISATNCVTNWLASVSGTGTFIQAENVTWPRSASGIPTGWVDIEKRTMPSGYKQVEYVANPNKPSATPMPLVETGIVLDPSQDTMEIAVFPHIGDDGYIAHHQYGGLPIANSVSPAQSGAKVGRFYCMYRKPTSGNNLIQFSWTNATSANSTLVVTNKIAETPQVLRIELSSGNNKMLLNGTQVATNSDACDMSDPGTETAKLFGISNAGYNWIDPIYYYKHWRSGVLIADYVACVRESDNEPSFYDFVSNTFKVPSRTGFYVAGQEI